MKKINNDSKIATYIVLAQVASDGGKSIRTIASILGKQSFAAYRAGYDAKDSYILKAIRAIVRSSNSRFRFYVKETLDQNGFDSLIVYFTYKSAADGTRHQISFHSFGWTTLLKFVTPSTRTKKMGVRWDHKNSRETAVNIALEFLGDKVNEKFISRLAGNEND